MIRPTRNALMLVLGGLPLSLLALVDGDLWAVGVGYAFLALGLIQYDAMRAVRPSALAVNLDAPQSVGVGDEASVDLTITTRAAASPHALEAVCDITGEVGAEARRPALAVGGNPALARIALRPLRRGEITIDRAWLRWQGPWGLVARQTIGELGHAMAATPDIERVKAAATQFVMRDSYVGLKVRRELGGGTDFDSLNEYVPGQDLRVIDWKRSARHRKLMVKEFQAERNHHVMLAIDTGHLMREPVDGLPRLDHAINAGLLLTYLSLRTGDRVGLMGFDSQVRQFLAPQSGLAGFSRVLDACARLAYRSEEANFTLALTDLAQRLNRRALIVVFTELVDTITAELMIENLGRLARRHLVVFVTMDDPALADAADARPQSVATIAQAVIASDMARDRAIVIERIRRLGIHCVSARAPSLATGLIERYLTIRREELV